MEKRMSALEIRICVGEMKDVLKAWVGKIYEIDGTFLFKLNPLEGEKKGLIIEPGKRIHLTTMKHDTPDHPSSFAMLLRKHITNSKLIKIEQPDLERVLELVFEGGNERRILIAELFGAGNLLLCDRNHMIIKPYKSRTWKHRELKAGNEYTLPPRKGRDLSGISKNDLTDILSDSPDLVRGLARNLNIGGQLAEEICGRSGLDKSIGPDELSKTDYENLYSAIGDLLSSDVSPIIIYENDEPSDVLPFPFETKGDLEAEPFESFNQALDHYFQKVAKRRAEKIKGTELEEKLDKIRSRLDDQERSLQGLIEKAHEVKEKADAISTHHKKIDGILEKLEKVRKSEGWKGVKREVQEPSDAGKGWANLINSIQPEEGNIVLELPEKSVEIDIRNSSFENASKLYEEHKRLKNKIEGAKEAIEETKGELEEVEVEGVKIPPIQVPKQQRERKWYERFRWFFSPDGMLVIAGRDEKTNKEVVDKYMEPHDRYLHADLTGAPHTVIKGKGEEISETTILEAAKFAAMHSRAWRRGLASVEVYWVEPSQVSKEAPPGEYLPKGAYMIKGKRNYHAVPLEAGIGLIEKDGQKIPMCGPPSSVETHSDVLITIKPGPIKKSKLAKQIKSKLEENLGGEIDLDELIGILPPGSGLIED